MNIKKNSLRKYKLLKQGPKKLQRKENVIKLSKDFRET